MKWNELHTHEWNVPVRANVVIEDVLARKAISNAIANVLAIVEKFARTEIHNSWDIYAFEST